MKSDIKKEALIMAIKISDLTLPKEKLEKNFKLLGQLDGRKMVEFQDGIINLFCQNFDMKKTT